MTTPRTTGAVQGTLPQNVSAASVFTPSRTLAVGDANYQVVNTDFLIAVDSTTNAQTVKLPAAPEDGDTYVIADPKANAAGHNYTVDGNGHNVNAAATKVVSTSGLAVRCTFNAALNIWIAY